MAAKLIITHGLPASGKSTWAMQEHKKDPLNTIVVERDEIRTALYGEEYHKGNPDKRKEREVTEVQQQLMRKGLSEGKTVISSDTNLNVHSISSLNKLAQEYDAKIEQQYFHVSVGECKRRNEERRKNGGRFVPPFVIDNMAKSGLSRDGSVKEFKIGAKTVFPYDRTGSDGEREVKAYNVKQAKKYGEVSGGTINFDMDGTLADTREISNEHMFQKRDFDAFHKASEFVPPNPDVLKIALQAHEGGIPITVTTARADTFAGETIRWLDKHGVPVSRLYMREEGDFRADFEVKNEILEKAKNEGIFFAHCIDDNPQAIQAWEDNGIIVTKVPFHTPEDPNSVEGKYEKIVIPSPLSSGECIRCGKPLKSGSIGPICRTRMP